MWEDSSDKTWLENNVKICARCGKIHFVEFSRCTAKGCEYPAYYGYNTIFDSKWHFAKALVKQWLGL